MKIIKLKGGLGNQLFQYSFAKLIEHISNEEVKIDLSSYAKLENDTIRKPRIEKFNISLPSATYRDLQDVCMLSHNGNPLSISYKVGIEVESVINKKYFREKNRLYINPESILKYQIFDGYWQSWRYVDRIYPLIKDEITAKEPISQKSEKFALQIKNENSVFVGVRRGDYKKLSYHYGSFGTEYYLNAIKEIEKNVENPVYYIFSNDIEWCKKNITLGRRLVNYREDQFQTNDFEELMLMSNCKHAVIVNSTYHWWGAYLINNPNKIIVGPEKWFNDKKPIDIQKPEWRWI